jgi:hypothetical protein
MEYLFIERQRFNQWWLWLILIGVNGLIAFTIVIKLIEQPANIGLWFAVITILFFSISFYFFILETKVNEKGIEVRFFPFHFSFITISWDQLEKVELRQYNPLKEYGGWGLRYGSRGKAYNVSGNIGVQLFFKNGNSLLIGTNKKKEAVLKKLSIFK